MTTIATEKMAALREPFPPAVIDKLPKGGRLLDYVGHAAVTDRLLKVDPLWNWEPLAFTEEGLPLFVLGPNGTPVGLWIKLTVAGVTRLGFGSVLPGAFDAEKQLIGDALRNAAMRFGVALDLWSKSDLYLEESEQDVPPPTKRSPRQETPREATGGTTPKARPEWMTKAQRVWVDAGLRAKDIPALGLPASAGAADVERALGEWRERITEGQEDADDAWVLQRFVMVVTEAGVNKKDAVPA